MTWLKILALGLIGSAIAAGCTVTTDDDGEEDGGGTGGKTSTGGSTSTGGKSSTGGKDGGSTGGASTGGAGTGGKDAGGTANCDAKATDNDCIACVKKKCCTPYLECGDDAACSYKSPTDEGELICMQDCLIKQIDEAGSFDVATCAGECAVDSSGIVSSATDALIACIRDVSADGGASQNCSTECFGGDLQLP